MATKGDVAIIGAGLVGSLEAGLMAKRGYKVHLYEKRPDLRTQPEIKGRSVNLALSKRGLDALARLGKNVEEQITKTGIPMRARMIHDRDGTLREIPYGKKGQYILSLDRRDLNERLMTIAEEFPGVTLHLEHELLDCDVETAKLTFARPEGQTATAQPALVLGCDGAYSAMRQVLMKNTRLDFSQEYIQHGYLELCIPPKNGQFAMAPNFLHIWARNEFMMIALPNAKDMSFVVTLFMPFEMYDRLKTNETLLEFFNEQFQDSIPLIGRDALCDQFFGACPMQLISVKCSPHYYGNRILLLGDSSHAMVPFYGQGMNCGFEDCIVLDSLLDEFDDDFTLALKNYNKTRVEDAHAICDLAMYNYIEMRKSVNSRLFLLRKKIDGIINWFFPASWVPLYTTILTRIGYSSLLILCATGLAVATPHILEQARNVEWPSQFRHYF